MRSVRRESLSCRRIFRAKRGGVGRLVARVRLRPQPHDERVGDDTPCSRNALEQEVPAHEQVHQLVHLGRSIVHHAEVRDGWQAGRRQLLEHREQPSDGRQVRWIDLEQGIHAVQRTPRTRQDAPSRGDLVAVFPRGLRMNRQPLAVTHGLRVGEARPGCTRRPGTGSASRLARSAEEIGTAAIPRFRHALDRVGRHAQPLDASLLQRRGGLRARCPVQARQRERDEQRCHTSISCTRILAQSSTPSPRRATYCHVARLTDEDVDVRVLVTRRHVVHPQRGRGAIPDRDRVLRPSASRR